MIDYDRLEDAVGNLEEEAVMDIVNKVAAAGEPRIERVVAAFQKGLETVGDRFESGEYFVGDLIFAGDLMSKALDLVRPLMTCNSENRLGKIVLCTVEGDLHDIGKNIVKGMMEAAGFEVLDLGIDTPPADIVKSLQESGARILGLSGVLTLAIDSMKRTVDALVEAELREKVKVIIGGVPVNADNCKFIGADAWSYNAAQGVKICREWASEN
ncbi:MAG: cobalamin B12-binding domain-containing protein [Dethiobacteria bacterium]|jgi:dimethylamine corrinoid protein|nr:cobalamin-binding protein [Bacillota bacterium]